MASRVQQTVQWVASRVRGNCHNSPNPDGPANLATVLLCSGAANPRDAGRSWNLTPRAGVSWVVQVGDGARAALLAGMGALSQAEVGAALQVYFNLDRLPAVCAPHREPPHRARLVSPRPSCCRMRLWWPTDWAPPQRGCPSSSCCACNIQWVVRAGP